MAVGLHAVDRPAVVGGRRDLPAASFLESDEQVRAARRLQASEYLRVGYVAAVGALADDGTLRPEQDPWVGYSRHFGAVDPDGVVRATCRVISGGAPWPLPTLELPGIDPVVSRELARLPARQLGEISALARDPAVGGQYTRAVFRAVWLDAIDRGLTDWVLCVDQFVLRVLRTMDERLFRIVGEWSPAPVRPVLPVRVRVADVREEIFTRGLVEDVVVLP